MIDGVDSSLQALSTVSTSMAVTANNVANVNTDGFQQSSVTLETGPDGEGVRVQDIRPDESPGPVYPQYLPVENNQGVMEPQLTYVEGSNTDIATQMVNMITDSHAYSANLAAIRTEDQMAGTVLDIIA